MDADAWKAWLELEQNHDRRLLMGKLGWREPEEDGNEPTEIDDVE